MTIIIGKYDFKIKDNGKEYNSYRGRGTFDVCRKFPLLVGGRGSIPHTCAAIFPLLYQFCCACACCSVDQACIHSWC